jgi:hypothetical protein
MKLFILGIIGAFVAEIVIILFATIAGFSGLGFYIAAGMLPVAIIVAAIYFFIRSMLSNNSIEDKTKSDSGE